MLLIQKINAVSAWRETFLKLFYEGEETDNSFYFRDELVVIELEHPSIEPSDARFPMPQEELDVINRFIVSGDDEESVSHEWTKLYFHRMFDEPHSQVRYIIERLKDGELERPALMSLWDKTIDQDQIVSPCTLVIWARKKHEKLELHVHAHSSDAYKKLLMNLQEFVALHCHLAELSQLAVGRYYHVIDSCHIHHADLQNATNLAAQLV